MRTYPPGCASLPESLAGTPIGCHREMETEAEITASSRSTTSTGVRPLARPATAVTPSVRPLKTTTSRTMCGVCRKSTPRPADLGRTDSKRGPLTAIVTQLTKLRPMCAGANIKNIFLIVLTYLLVGFTRPRGPIASHDHPLPFLSVLGFCSPIPLHSWQLHFFEPCFNIISPSLLRSSSAPSVLEF